MKTCNQCHEEMTITKIITVLKFHEKGENNFEFHRFFCCSNPECPNYALLQIPLEDMPKEEE